MAHEYRSYVICDIETASDIDALALLKEAKPRKGTKDEEKLAAQVAEKQAAILESMSLDPFAGRIVCIGWQTEDDTRPVTFPCATREQEGTALDELAAVIRGTGYRHVIGYRVLAFDLPWLMTRSRLLGVNFPALDTRKYGNRDITDVHAYLTNDGNCPPPVIVRSLHNMARRFGIPVHDELTGADVAALVKEGRLEDVRAHCASDVALTRGLAQRLGLVPAVAVGARLEACGS